MSKIFRWVRHGWHQTKRAPFLVRRFRCKDCRRTFSTQTFHFSYWQKRPEIDRDVFFGARGCSGNRQIAAALGCGKSTVAEKITRLARQAVRFHVAALAAGAPLGGDSIFDGLGSFEHSQYWPYWLNAAVHRDSSFVLGFTESPLRRSGTMTPKQKVRRAELESALGRPNPGAVRQGTEELLRSIAPFLDLSTTRLVSDEHLEYPRAIRAAGLGAIPHLRISGKESRTSANPLFEINLLDMVIRHGNSSQKRETIAFNKRRQAGLERGWILLIWRNYFARRRAKWSIGPTPAELAGIASRRLSFEDVFENRLLPDSVTVPAAWQRHIDRTVITPAVGRNRLHEAAYCT